MLQYMYGWEGTVAIAFIRSEQLELVLAWSSQRVPSS